MENAAASDDLSKRRAGEMSIVTGVVGAVVILMIAMFSGAPMRVQGVTIVGQLALLGPTAWLARDIGWNRTWFWKQGLVIAIAGTASAMTSAIVIAALAPFQAFTIVGHIALNSIETIAVLGISFGLLSVRPSVAVLRRREGMRRLGAGRRSALSDRDI